MDENAGIEFFLDEAEDGKVAVDKCKNGDFDIVLMDIMMPNMDGIEATKIIRENDKKIMIIAVSAVDDSDRKKLILNNGAEDYVAKPVNADIFISRMANYITLIEARRNKKTTSSGINLFSDEIFNRHMRFIINSDDALSEFWEYFLLGSEHKCDNLSDVIRTIFAIADIQRRLNIDTDIYVEDSENSKYFTLVKIDEVPLKIVKLTLKKNNFSGSYKIDDGKISFELGLKFNSLDEPIFEEEKTIIKEEIKEEEIASPLNLISSIELTVFDYIDKDDLYDLEEYANKLNSIMLV
ncbi:MAG: response regulator, partial [Campylobacterota bacterium]|nr:response regulator [Campylobacterota bacterium]